MADETKRYLDYDGLAHLVELLTNRIQAVGGDYLPLKGGTVTGDLTVQGDTSVKKLTASGDLLVEGYTTVKTLFVDDGGRVVVDEGASVTVNADASVTIREMGELDVEGEIYYEATTLSDPTTGDVLFLRKSDDRAMRVTLDALKSALGVSEQWYTRVTQPAYIFLADDWDDGGGDNWSYLKIQSNEGWSIKGDGSSTGWLFVGDEGDPIGSSTWNGSKDKTFILYTMSRNSTGSPRRAELTLKGSDSGHETIISVVQLA